MAGEGSIFRIRKQTPDGEAFRWRAQVSLGPRSNRRYLTRTVLTRAEARRALDELRADLRGGVTRTRLTTGDYLEQWVASVRNIRPTTRQSYRSDVVNHLVPLIGPVRLSELSPLHVEDALARLEPRLSPKSLKNVHATLRRALTQGVRAGHLSRNVASREFVDAPRVTVEEPEAFTAAEVQTLLGSLEGERLSALFVLAVATGLRQGELLGLAWQDIDLDVGSVTVRHELARVGGRYSRVDPKTSESRRTVPLSPAVVVALRAHRERLIAEGFLPTATGPVFTNTSGGPINGTWLTHHAQRLYAAAGIRVLDFKALRATFASRLYGAGVSDMEIARLMGHTRTHTTKRHYIALGERHASAVEAIEGMVG
jgi:integrase